MRLLRQSKCSRYELRWWHAQSASIIRHCSVLMSQHLFQTGSNTYVIYLYLIDNQINLGFAIHQTIFPFIRIRIFSSLTGPLWHWLKHTRLVQDYLGFLVTHFKTVSGHLICWLLITFLFYKKGHPSYETVYGYCFEWKHSKLLL